jgi:cell division protein FtsB
MMKIINFLLLVLLAALQYRYWSGHNGVQFYNDNREEVAKLKVRNEELLKRNELLEADIQDLKVGTEGIEERARNELGMIRENETFFRIVPAKKEQE